MNSRWTDPGAWLRPATLLVLLVLATSCSGDEKGDRKAEKKPPADPAQADAEMLGREVFDVVDRIMSFRSSHQNKLPVSFRQAGIDSLTPAIVRRYVKNGSTPVVTAVFRRPEGHPVRSCQGTSDVLEEASLHEGAYSLTCTLAGGATRSFTVGAPVPE